MLLWLDSYFWDVPHCCTQYTDIQSNKFKKTKKTQNKEAIFNIIDFAKLSAHSNNNVLEWATFRYYHFICTSREARLGSTGWSFGWTGSLVLDNKKYSGGLLGQWDQPVESPIWLVTWLLEALPQLKVFNSGLSKLLQISWPLGSINWIFWLIIGQIYKQYNKFIDKWPSTETPINSIWQLKI